MIFDDLPGRVSAAPVERIAPLEVLYEFDGPRIFSLSSRDGNSLLACLCDQAEGGLTFLLAPSSVRSIERLKSGQIGVREAIDQARIWLVSCDRQWKILGAKSASFDEFPDAVLPRESALLFPERIPLPVPGKPAPL